MAVRILSAFIGIVIGVAVLIIDNVWVYTAVMSVISAIAIYEMTRAVKCDKHKLLRWFCIITGAVMPFIRIIEQLRFLDSLVTTLFILVLFGIRLKNHKTITYEQLAMCGFSTIALSFSLSSLILLRYYYPDGKLGVFLILFTLFSAWFGDSGAYFVGTFLGKHKLCPNVSPKKTVEGLIGGVVTVGIVTVITCIIYNAIAMYKVELFVMVPVSMVASLVGVLGDLSASVIKREFDVKDFGNIMPGHGGVIDRFDSVFFVAPVVYFLFTFFPPSLGL
ncbi:MAG: phosphatidate cytidylyltransferase [Oscillospiraceae bacterium]